MASKLDGLDPEARRLLGSALAELERMGIRATISSGYRSPEKQRQLWENRFSNPYPVAPPGRSKHEHGTAVDLVLADEKQRQKANQVLSRFGWQWPLGDRDKVHYEFDPGKSPVGLTHGKVTAPSVLEIAARPPARTSVLDLAKQPKRSVLEMEVDEPKQRKSVLDLVAPPAAPKSRTADVAAALGKQPAQPTIPGMQIRLRPGDPKQGELAEAMKPINTVKGIASGVGTTITRLTAPLAAAPGAINAITQEALKERKKYGGRPPIEAQNRAVVRGVKKALPAAMKAVEKAWKQGEPTQFNLWTSLRQDPEYGPAMARMGPIPEIMDFATQMVIDARTAGVQGRVVTALKKPAAAAAGKVIAKVPALQRVTEGRSGYQQAAQTLNRTHAQVSNKVMPKLDDWHKDIEQTSKKTRVRTVDPATGQPVNELSRLVADYMDAGAKGSRHEAASSAVVRGTPGRNAQAVRRNNELRAVRAEADAMGVPWKDVERIGKKGQAITDDLGQMMVDAGLLKPEAYDQLRGSYLPRSYLLTSGDLSQRASFLDRLEKAGALTPRAALEYREKAGVLGPRQGVTGTRVHPEDFMDPRELDEFAQRVDPTKARAATPEATPALTSYAQRGVNAVADAQGHAQIAQNPNLARKLDDATEIPPGWRKMTLNDEDYVVNPGVHRYLQMRSSPPVMVKFLQENFGPKAASNYQNTMQMMRRLWVSSPKTAFNNIVGNYVLGESAAAVHGARFHPAGYLKAAREWKQYRKTGKASPDLEAALSQTDILGEGVLAAPKEARSFKGGFGVETLGEKARAAPGKAFDWWGDTAYGDPEKAGRYYLFKELMASGKTPQEAGEIVNAAMITYSDIGPIRRFLEQNNLAPFVTFPTKAIFQYANTALHRPDRFYTYTGERLRDFLDQLADDEARKEGRTPVAERKRRLGEVTPFEIPVPSFGLPFLSNVDEEGKQRYISGQIAGPMLGGLLANKAGSGVSGLGESLVGSAAERLTTAVPLLNVARDIATNKQTYNQQPIVVPGSIPGTTGGVADAFTNPEVAKAYGGYLFSSFVPEARDVGRIIGASRGERAFASPGAPKLQLPASVLKLFTGIRTETGVGYNPLERKLEKGEDLLATLPDSEYKNFLMEYGQHLGQRITETGGQGIMTVFNPRYRQVAEGIRDMKTLRDTMEGAKKTLATLIDHDDTKGDARKKKIREMFDWIISLGQAQIKLLQDQSGSLTPEQQDLFSGTPLDASP